MQVVRHLGAEFDVDGEQGGQLFFALENPSSAVGVVFAGQRIAPAETGAAYAAVPAMKDSLTWSSDEFATRFAHHGDNPFRLGPVVREGAGCAHPDAGPRVIAALRLFLPLG